MEISKVLAQPLVGLQVGTSVHRYVGTLVTWHAGISECFPRGVLMQSVCQILSLGRLNLQVEIVNYLFRPSNRDHRRIKSNCVEGGKKKKKKKDQRTNRQGNQEIKQETKCLQRADVIT